MEGRRNSGDNPLPPSPLTRIILTCHSFMLPRNPHTICLRVAWMGFCRPAFSSTSQSIRSICGVHRELGSLSVPDSFSIIRPYYVVFVVVVTYSSAYVASGGVVRRVEVCGGGLASYSYLGNPSRVAKTVWRHNRNTSVWNEFSVFMTNVVWLP